MGRPWVKGLDRLPRPWPVWVRWPVLRRGTGRLWQSWLCGDQLATQGSCSATPATSCTGKKAVTRRSAAFSARPSAKHSSPRGILVSGHPGSRKAHSPRGASSLPRLYQCDTPLLHRPPPGSGPLTTYSLWCADMCKSFTRKVDDTLMTMNCCQTSLCNIPPWQGSQGNGAGDHQGGPKTVAAALLLSLLTGLQAMGS